MEPINAFPLRSNASSLDSVDNDAGNVPTSKFDGKMRLLHTTYSRNIGLIRTVQGTGTHRTSGVTAQNLDSKLERSLNKFES